MTELTIPDRMRKLPTTDDGRVIPWYVAIEDGVPNFEQIRPDGIGDALRFKLCWLCGQQNGRYAAFLTAATGAVNTVAAEPPAHRDCAQYAALAGLRPGVALVWVTRDWFMFRDVKGLPLFNIGKPDQTYWYVDGRAATRDEIEAAIEDGMPALRKRAAEAGALAAVELELNARDALKLLPA